VSPCTVWSAAPGSTAATARCDEGARDIILRIGIIYELQVALFDAGRQRYNVRVLAPRDAVERCGGMAWVRPGNVRAKGEALVAVEFGKEWRDETGKVFKKNTDFGRLCPRSHELALRPTVSSLCSICGDVSDAAMWQCRDSCNYRVCALCHAALDKQRLQPDQPPAVLPEAADGVFPVMVRSNVTI
jgi:hypothetical protein